MAFVIPFFIPHQGCPHQCLFCNQQSITGRELSSPASRRDIDAVISRWLAYGKPDDRGRPAAVQFAFYGGSFTCLPKGHQTAMLEAVAPWVHRGEIETIRLSTRPDCVDATTCGFLRRYGVGCVELGVQSLDDEVLEASRRGHDSNDCHEAMEYIKKSGLRAGIQLMPGLPGETRHSFRRTVEQTIALAPSFVRLYPVLVVQNSGLALRYNDGGYTPLSLEMAVVLTAWARSRLLDAGIPVVRMGLQPSASLEKSVLAGPYHPAFGELVMARQWLHATRKVLAAHPGKKIQLTIAERDLSCFNGVGRVNRTRLRHLGLEQRLEVVVDNNLERGSMHYVVG